MRKSVALLLVFVFLIVSTIATPLPVKAEPKTIIVPDDYPTIQEAIDNASAGDTVFVKNGVYHEHITIDKPLSLIGKDPQNTVIIGLIQRFAFFAAIEVEADNILISGFTIKDGDMGIRVDKRKSCKIIGNNIENNSVGMNLGYGENHIVQGNKIKENRVVGLSVSSKNSVINDNDIMFNGWIAKDIGIGISAGGENLTVCDNNISNNTRGLELSHGPIFVYKNEITLNQEYGIQFAEGCGNSLVYQNNIIRNSIGVNLLNFPLGGDATIGSGNIVYLNNFEDNLQQAFVERAWFGINTYGNGTDVVSWDNGREGNYWSDYQSRYPNAAEVGTSGTGDTPYVIDENNADYYPLLLPVDISAESTPQLPEREPFPTVLVAIASIGLVAGIGAGLLVYFKKRKRVAG